MKLLLIYESNPKVGLGHFKRSSDILQAAKLDNIIIERVELSQIDTVNNKYFDGLILDLPRSSQILDRFTHINRKLCFGLDWYGDKDVDINICVFEPTKASAKLFVASGLQYSIIRMGIRDVKENIPLPNSALISLGGGDLLGQSYSALTALADKFNCTVVSGIYADNSSKNTDMSNPLVDPDNFPLLLSRSEIVISNGGGTLLESIFLNKTVIPLPQTELETLFCKFLLKNKYIFNIGVENLYEKVLESKKIQREFFIDGLGSCRITTIIKNELYDA